MIMHICIPPKSC